MQRPALLRLFFRYMSGLVHRWGSAAYLFEQAGERAYTFKTHIETNSINGHALLKKQFSFFHPHAYKVLMRGFTKYLFKTPYEVELGEPRLSRNAVEVYTLRVVRIDIHLGLYQPVVEVEVRVCLLCLHKMKIGNLLIILQEHLRVKYGAVFGFAYAYTCKVVVAFYIFPVAGTFQP